MRARPRVTWRWNAYTRFCLVVGSARVFLGGSGAHLPGPDIRSSRRECVRVLFDGRDYRPLAPANELLPWWQS